MLSYGYYYAGGLLVGAAVATYLLGWPYARSLLYSCRVPPEFLPRSRASGACGTRSRIAADGKVVAIRPVASGAKRISIFLNIFDVHVNRTPIPGKVDLRQLQERPVPGRQ